MQSLQGPLDLNVTAYPIRWQIANQIAQAYQAQAIITLGGFVQAGERHTLDELLVHLRINEGYRVLLNRWLDNLVENGWLYREGDFYINPEPLSVSNLEALWNEAHPLLADIQPLADYLYRSGNLLPAVLTGEESPLETLFPGGDYTTGDFLYNDWALPRYFNSIVAKAVAAAADNYGGQFRILEIGAGTGGTSAMVLPALPQDRVRYTFTDVSDFFLGRAEERFAAYPFINYALLDIEQDPAEQGFPEHGFDLIIAANVLHATSNLDDTLNHVRSLLAPGGILVLYEASEHPAWFDITVGLIEGWSKFEDKWRGHHPLLAGERWSEALRHNGFEAVDYYPRTDNPARHLLHNVILAQVPQFALVSEIVYDEIIHSSSAASSDVNEPASNALREQLDKALPGDRLDILANYVRDHVRRALRVTADHQLGTRERLLDLGFDSLMALELRSKLSTGLALPKSLPASLIFDYPTIEAIAGYLLSLIEKGKVDARQDSVQSDVNGTDNNEVAFVPSDVSSLSDTEVEELLLKKLRDL
jgi:SAM-dependent methyltransferase